MRRKLIAAVALLLIVCMISPTILAESDWYDDPNAGSIAEANHNWGPWVDDEANKATCVSRGMQIRTCSSCGLTEERVVGPTDSHKWGEWTVTKPATCAEEGSQTRTCTVCRQKQETQAIPKTNAHKWGDWSVSKQATCQEKGQQSRKCAVCGKTETQITEKLEHAWGEWKVTKEPTCTQRGKKQRSCSRCGELQYLNIKELGHEAGEWAVTKEPTCQKTGEQESACIYCGKKMTKKLNRVGHDYQEWETTEEATDFSKGKRQSVCRFCKRKKTEEFYPEGTLARKLENDPDAVKEMQAELMVLGLYKGKNSGTFDKGTEDAVKKFEKGLGLTVDGIAWPGVLKLLLGPGPSSDLPAAAAEEEGTGPDPAKYKLQLEVKRTSPKKDFYTVGDEITYQWTLTNASTKTSSKNTKMYHYDIKKAVKQKEVLIEDIGTLKPGESATGIYTYEVTSDDAIAGKFRHGFIGRGNMGGKVASNPRMFTHSATAGKGGGKGGWTPPLEEALSITKTVTDPPKNTFFFVKGETIKFRIEIKNKITESVDDVIVTDKLLGDSWKKTIGTLAGGDSKTYDVEYTVTTKNVSDTEVVNTAVVSYTQDGNAKMSKASVTAKTGMSTDGVYIHKTCTNAPANGLFFVPGETVKFDIEVLNPTTDKTFKNLKIYEWLKSKSVPYKTLSELKPGKSVVYSYSTKVTQYQGKIGKLTNTASVTYKHPDKKKLQVQVAECTVPCGLPGQDGVIVTKKVISTPDNGSYYTEGEEIRYLIEIKNNTVKDILTMDIRDSLADLDDKGYRTIQAGETLKAGETYEIHFSYYVAEEDVENTKVTNVASAYWSMEKDEFTETYSEPVTVPTAPVVSNRKPDLKKLTGDACTPSLTGLGEGVEQRDLTECADHTETAQEAEKLIAGGDYEEAILLWDDEIENLYQEWKQGVEGESRRIAENEQVAFIHQMSALNASLSLVCSEEEVKAIAAEERMEKCIGLCYELHTAPEDRPDSAAGIHTELKKGKTTDNCRRDVNYTADGPVRLKDDLCESHTMTTELTQTLLEAAEDDEDREIVWLRAQDNWLLELDMMYDTWYLSADPAQRTLIAADRMSFDELINARRESLAMMYPDDPDTAEEVLADMIMHRTELICRILHEAGILKD